MITKKIDIPIYHGYLVIAFAKNLDKANKKLGLDLEQQDRGAFVQAKRKKNGVSRYFVVFSTKDLTHCTIAHEVTHLANWIFHDRNIKLDLLNDEAYAYLVGWFTKEIYKLAYKKKVEVITNMI